MTGSEWLQALPENPGADRDQAIIDAVNNNLLTFDWVDITSTIENHTATFTVLSDAAWVTLDDCSRFRPMVSATLTQKIADILSVSMVTAKIHDLSYSQSIQLECSVLPAGPLMETISYSKRWNLAVENKRNGCATLVRDTGKIWCLDNALAHSRGAINFGFYSHAAPSTSPGGFKLYQGIGTMHDQHHQDYSQTLFLMKKECVVDGQPSDIQTTLSDPELATLGNYGGILKYFTQP
jgi:hypothetical protein